MVVAKGAGRGVGADGTSSRRSPALADDANAVRGPRLVDVDALVGPFGAGPALDGLDVAAGDGFDPEAVASRLRAGRGGLGLGYRECGSGGQHEGCRQESVRNAHRSLLSLDFRL